jgi:hypothetical protein
VLAAAELPESPLGVERERELAAVEAQGPALEQVVAAVAVAVPEGAEPPLRCRSDRLFVRLGPFARRSGRSNSMGASLGPPC